MNWGVTNSLNLSVMGGGVTNSLNLSIKGSYSNLCGEKMGCNWLSLWLSVIAKMRVSRWTQTLLWCWDVELTCSRLCWKAEMLNFVFELKHEVHIGRPPRLTKDARFASDDLRIWDWNATSTLDRGCEVRVWGWNKTSAFARSVSEALSLVIFW